MGALWAALLLISSSLGAGECLLCSKKRLLEYSCDYFGEEGYRGPSSVPLLHPPELVLYRDGTVIFERDGRFHQGNLTAKAVARVVERLERSSILQRTALLTTISGDEPLMHGGICHLTYRDGESAVTVAATRVPRGGEWQRAVGEVRKRIPSAALPYRPSDLKLRVFPQASCNWQEWPYSEALDLARVAELPSVELTDGSVIDFLFSRRPRSGTWYFSQEQAGYKVILLEVAGWYEPNNLEETIWQLTEGGRLLD